MALDDLTHDCEPQPGAALPAPSTPVGAFPPEPVEDAVLVVLGEGRSGTTCGSNIGIGFATPIDRAADVVERIIDRA